MSNECEHHPSVGGTGDVVRNENRWIYGDETVPEGWECRGVDGVWYDAIDWNESVANDGDLVASWLQFPIRQVKTNEIEQLHAWKAEATEVLGDWERLYVALGSPGRPGGSKAAAALAEVERRISVASADAERLAAANAIFASIRSLVGAGDNLLPVEAEPGEPLFFRLEPRAEEAD